MKKQTYKGYVIEKSDRGVVVHTAIGKFEVPSLPLAKVLITKLTTPGRIS